MDETVVEGWWVQFVAVFVTAILTTFIFLVRKLVNFLIKKMEASDAEKEAFQALLEGMAIAQNEIVREAKATSKNGRLTKDEIIRSEQIAWAHAKKIASSDARKVMIGWTMDRVSSLIKQLLGRAIV